MNHGYIQVSSKSVLHSYSLYFKKKITALIIYVNDMIVIGNDPAEISSLQQYLAFEFEMKQLGKTS